MEAMRWAEFYHNHDKYRFVGVLRVDPVEEAVAKALEMEDAIKVHITTKNVFLC